MNYFVQQVVRMTGLVRVVIFNVFLFHASSYFQRVAVTSVTWQIPHLGMNLLLLMGISYLEDVAN